MSYAQLFDTEKELDKAKDLIEEFCQVMELVHEDLTATMPAIDLKYRNDLANRIEGLIKKGRMP
jgi:hypothetical protein